MKKVTQFFREPRPAGAMLVIGIFAGITIGGGVGVVASPSSKPVTVCVNQANFMRYSKTNRCAAGETRVAIGQTGAVGAKGDTGAAGTNGTNGATGAKGDTGATGAKGDTGAVGAKGDTGATGAKGDTGDRGTNGTNGTNGINATAITPQSVCDGSDAGTVANEVCKVGMTGPGGGLIFYVDHDDEYATYDYLEAAPTDTFTGSPWSTSTPNCGASQNATCLNNPIYSNGDTDLTAARGSHRGLFGGKAATASIVARHDAGSVAKTLYAAGKADDYEVNGKSDWWLPSKEELEMMQEKLNHKGLGNFSSMPYWSASEIDSNDAWLLTFATGKMVNQSKSFTFVIRPVRAF